MPFMPNTSNPDVNTFDVDSHKMMDVESIPDDEDDSNSEIPVPPDRQADNVPIEEPPDVKDKPPVDEDYGDDIERIV